ncbi:hypothetical protein BU26DRAFT_565666 [Trematosphaeria pertusa]|uniref:Uncharacterized protein n=1 Tax=Trematosphaeria pertusa TaxID=390896 RepID=A0A6A6IED5_9PLEO|nr:uncharacterized protein BU26DRAFT_565666 [Trematosphaeria pertusa]KAF2248262.1 hypothetical protein BU26DRAFT_565666 [Trematosphaeria pertusa]
MSPNGPKYLLLLTLPNPRCHYHPEIDCSRRCSTLSEANALCTETVHQITRSGRFRASSLTHNSYDLDGLTHWIISWPNGYIRVSVVKMPHHGHSGEVEAPVGEQGEGYVVLTLKQTRYDTGRENECHVLGCYSDYASARKDMESEGLEYYEAMKNEGEYHCANLDTHGLGRRGCVVWKTGPRQLAHFDVVEVGGGIIDPFADGEDPHAYLSGSDDEQMADSDGGVEESDSDSAATQDSNLLEDDRSRTPARHTCHTSGLKPPSTIPSTVYVVLATYSSAPLLPQTCACVFYPDTRSANRFCTTRATEIGSSRLGEGSGAHPVYSHEDGVDSYSISSRQYLDSVFVRPIPRGNAERIWDPYNVLYVVFEETEVHQAQQGEEVQEEKRIMDLGWYTRKDDTERIVERERAAMEEIVRIGELYHVPRFSPECYGGNHSADCEVWDMSEEKRRYVCFDIWEVRRGDEFAEEGLSPGHEPVPPLEPEGIDLSWGHSVGAVAGDSSSDGLDKLLDDAQALGHL